MSKRYAAGVLSLIAACGAPPSACPPSAAQPAPPMAIVAPPPAAATPLDGPWRGSLGDGRLRLVLTLTREEGGSYRAVLESIDQGATIPVDKVTVAGDAIRLDVGKVGGSYEGKLDATRATMTGTWSQKGTSQPLVLTHGVAAEAPVASKARSTPLDAPIDVTIPTPPTAFRAEGKNHLAYELHVTNFSAREISIRKIEATNADTKASVAALEGDELAALASVRGAIGPGLRTIVYVWIDLPGDAPKTIDHRITVALNDGADEKSVTLPRLTVRTETPLVLAPPLRGGEWLAGNGPSRSSNHRRSLVPIGGRAHIAQRFAIDWLKVKDGTTFAGDAAANASYLAYGAEVLAVADGVIAETKDGIAENVPHKSAETPTLETVAGNHVVLDLGKGRFALYAHFQPKSLRVKVGDRVRRGQVLGLVGNSGNSTEPHLHFHVSDGASPLGSEGVPYVFDAFEAHGAKDQDFKKYARELVLEGARVRFPAK